MAKHKACALLEDYLTYSRGMSFARASAQTRVSVWLVSNKASGGSPMETRKETQESKRRFQITELEDRIAPTVAVDVLGLATIDLHLDLGVNVETPVASVDVNLTL